MGRGQGKSKSCLIIFTRASGREMPLGNQASDKPIQSKSGMGKINN
jgi:hypothetical protein